MTVVGQYRTLLDKKVVGYILAMFVAIIFVSDMITSLLVMTKSGIPEGFFDIVVNTAFMYSASALVLYMCFKRLGISFVAAILGGILWTLWGP